MLFCFADFVHLLQACPFADLSVLNSCIGTAGCCYCCLGLSVIFSLTMTSSAVAIGMQYTAIIWLFIINCIKSKSFDIRSFIPVCVVFAGVMFFMPSGSGETSVMGQLLTLSEGIFFAGLTISSKKAAGTNPLGLTAVGNLVTGVVLLTAFPNAGASIAALIGLDWALMIILGVVQIGCGYAFYNLGVQKISAQKASLLSLWEMLLGPLWVALFLGEYPSAPVLIGFVIIIIGILLDVKLNQKASEKAEAEVSAHHESSVSTVSC